MFLPSSLKIFLLHHGMFSICDPQFSLLPRYLKKWNKQWSWAFSFVTFFKIWWWCYPIVSVSGTFEGWRIGGRGGTPRKPNSRAILQGLDQKSKMEEAVSKMAGRRASVEGQSRRRVISYRNVNRRCKKNFVKGSFSKVELTTLQTAASYDKVHFFI